MSTPRVFYKRLDTYKPLIATVTDESGQAVNLTDADSVTFSMVNAETGELKIAAGAASFVDPKSSGKVKYPWDDNDLNEAGEFEGEFKVVWSASEAQRAPQKHRILVTVQAEVS